MGSPMKIPDIPRATVSSVLLPSSTLEGARPSMPFLSVTVPQQIQAPLGSANGQNTVTFRDEDGGLVIDLTRLAVHVSRWSSPAGKLDHEWGRICHDQRIHSTNCLPPILLHTAAMIPISKSAAGAGWMPIGLGEVGECLHSGFGPENHFGGEHIRVRSASTRRRECVAG